MTNIIPLNPTEQINITVNSIQVQTIGVAADNSGNWTIKFNLNTSIPSLTSQPGLNINQTYNAIGTVIVTRDEIMTNLGMPLSGSVLDATLGDVEFAISVIALDKLNNAFGW